MRGCIARMTAVFGTAAAAVLGVLGTTAPPATALTAGALSATAVPTGTTATTATTADRTLTTEALATSPGVTAASYRCVITADYGWRWEGRCNVYSGQLRTVTYCADGSHTTGLWIGARPQAWDVWGNCPGSSWTRILFQTRG
ncbi:hypothetical protein ACIRS1_01395 [Kitasatospora sp. NPDC101176]|uniref:hypothetical protein n=1 Tax=Kitasatospora sp. NPDC101176 TaxID=3364099 RepID=UPI00381ECB9F